MTFKAENWSRIDDQIGVENRCREKSERTGWSASGCLPEQVRLSEEGTHNLGPGGGLEHSQDVLETRARQCTESS